MRKLHKGIRWVCLLALIAALLTVAGVIYARYSTTRRETMIFEAALNDPSRALEIRSDEGWTTTEEGVSLTFALCNAGDVAGQRAYLRLTATEGLDADAVTVTLTVDGTLYEGVPHTIEPGEPLYATMGAGTEYRFYADDAEQVWAVSSAQICTLTVVGETDVSRLRLTATAA